MKLRKLFISTILYIKIRTFYSIDLNGTKI
nr:MAG TPA: hypothetical protein [Caudoviricetes sp.]